VVTAAGQGRTDGTGTKKRGRPRKDHDEAAIAKWEQGSNAMLLSSKAAYSMDKGVVMCDCGHEKHRMFVSVRVANKRPTCVCHVCTVLSTNEGSSSYERLVYRLCEAEDLIETYAVEACAVSESGELEVCDGTTACVSKKRWDVMVLGPASLLIEIQGEGHSTKLVTSITVQTAAWQHGAIGMSCMLRPPSGLVLVCCGWRCQVSKPLSAPCQKLGEPS